MARVAVVGAGVTGLLAAIVCARAGHRVTVLDRGAIPNPESTSFDQHRALRTLTHGDAAATGRMLAAHRRWLELESLLGTRFYRRVGVVTAWPAGKVRAVADFAAGAGVPVEILGPEKLPQLGLPTGSVGLLELDAGVLLAGRVLRGAARWLAGHPSVTLRPGRRVVAVDAHTGLIRLANGDTEGSDVVLVAAGPWTAELCPAPVVLHRQTMVYLRPPENLVRWWENAPAAGGIGAGGLGWVIPPGGGTLLKLSTDGACREVSTVDDFEAEAPWVARVLAAGIVSDVDSYTVVTAKRCHYATAGGALLARAGRAAWSRPASGGAGFSSAPLAAEEFLAAMEEAA